MANTTLERFDNSLGTTANVIGFALSTYVLLSNDTFINDIKISPMMNTIGKSPYYHKSAQSVMIEVKLIVESLISTEHATQAALDLSMATGTLQSSLRTTSIDFNDQSTRWAVLCFSNSYDTCSIANYLKHFNECSMIPSKWDKLYLNRKSINQIVSSDL